MSDAAVRALDPATGRLVRITDVPRPARVSAVLQGEFERRSRSVTASADAPLVAVGAGSVWVAGFGGPRDVVRVNPSIPTAVARVTLPAAVIGMAGDERGMWVLTDANSLVRIDPAQTEVAQVVPVIGDDPSVAIGPTSLWVSAADGITRLDPETGRVLDTIAGGGGPIGVRDGTVWARSPGSLGVSVVGIDEKSGRVVERAVVGTSARSLIAWSLPALNPFKRSDDTTEFMPRDPRIAIVDGVTWVVREDDGEMWRIAPS
jgi:hypothetical protein